MNRAGNRRGFTLIELIVVMSMLTVVLALAAPSLSRFFKGRTIVEESRRFMALTRYARDEAITLSVPLELWIDVELGYYGLSPMTGFEFETMKEVELLLDDELTFEVESGVEIRDGLMTIGFYPDGTMGDSEEPIRLILRDDEDEWLAIIQDAFSQEFSIVTQDEYAQLERTIR